MRVEVDLAHLPHTRLQVAALPPSEELRAELRRDRGTQPLAHRVLDLSEYLLHLVRVRARVRVRVSVRVRVRV